jgi:1-acyl-sn-glycerol-3-phosphate acyltransferase
MTTLRAFLFNLGLLAATVFFCVVGVFWLPLSHQKRYAFIALWSRLVLWWLGLTCGLRHQVQGLENLPKGPAVVLSKHESAWETIAFLSIFPPHSWVLKRELLKIPIFGWFLWGLKPIAIDRTQPRQALRQLLKQGSGYLDEKLWVLVFPEGTRVAPGEIRPYAIGGAALAERKQVPIVPVAHNAGDFWPRNSFLKTPGTIVVRIGPCLETAGKSASALNVAAQAWIDQETAYLHEQGQTP